MDIATIQARRVRGRHFVVRELSFGTLPLRAIEAILDESGESGRKKGRNLQKLRVRQPE
jgi:hypothetical protein